MLLTEKCAICGWPIALLRVALSGLSGALRRDELHECGRARRYLLASLSSTASRGGEAQAACAVVSRNLPDLRRSLALAHLASVLQPRM
jgi:hypothetical protein